MVLFSEDPSTGQNMPQNFCRGLGLPEPRFLKKAGTSSSSDAFPDCFLSAMARGALEKVLSTRPSVCGSLSLPGWVCTSFLLLPLLPLLPLPAYRKVHRKDGGLANWRPTPRGPSS